MNRDIQMIHMLSDNPADCSPIWSPGDELVDTVFVTVISTGMAEMVTTVLTVAVVVTDCTSVLVLVAMAVEVELMIAVLVSTSVLVLVSTRSSVLVMMVVDVEVMS